MDPEVRILHVDDQVAFLDLLAEFLEQVDDGIQVASETDPEAALERLDDEPVDVVVSDYRMPGMDGLAFLEALRAAHPDLPFILVTGQGSEEVASEALSLGATDYLQKGGGTEQYDLLANRIRNAVERRRAMDRADYLERTRAIVQDVNQALVRASSTDEIERDVCEIVGREDAVGLVAISSVDPATGRVDARTWSGVDRDELEPIAPVDPDGSGEEAGDDRQRSPFGRAFHDHEIGVERAGTDGTPAGWRPEAIEDDCQLLVVVPVVHGERRFGLLEIYATEERPIDEEARALLTELGDDIAHAFDAIHTQEELAASEARYRTLAETASDAILTIDTSSTITYANPASEELFGYPETELQGEPLTKLMPDRFVALHREGVERYLRTGDRNIEWTGVELPGERADGSELPLAISFGEYEHDGQQFFTGIIRDVSERTERNAELQRQNERLEEFAGIVAHDLRTPLDVASGRVKLARREHDSDHLSTAAANLDRMDTIVEDLLTLARLESAGDRMEVVDLADLVAAARQVLHDRDATVETDPALGTVVGHRSQVRELLENLFRNAADHGGPDVTVRVEMLADGFAVEDDGPGVPADHRETVFETGVSTKEHGTGFGLRIVEMIADAHGWTVTVTDGSAGGARFEITGVELVG